MFESLGFSRMMGVDLSPKAIEINKAAHPKYELKVVDGFNWGEGDNIDVAYHSGVLCQVRNKWLNIK